MKSMAERLWCMVGLIMLTTVAFPSGVTPEYLKAQTKGASTNVRIRIVDDADNSIADASVNSSSTWLADVFHLGRKMAAF